MIDTNLIAKDKLIRARVKLQKEKPFFSYLIMKLNLIEDNKKTETAGVNIRGDLYYNTDFIDKLNEEEVKTLLAHEVFHIVLHHLSRRGHREANLFNITADYVVNTILLQNNFEFSGELKNGCVPVREYDREGYCLKYVNKKGDEKFIEKIEGKSVEELFYILNKELPEQVKKEMSSFGDEHYESKPSNELEKAEQQKQEGEWARSMVEALTYSKQQGNTPVGMERLVEQYIGQKVSWKEKLYKYITNEIMSDYTYNRPSKRSIATGFYMPSILKENIEIAVAIDTSGSISTKELSEFLGEVVNISKSFKEVKIFVLFCDAEVSDCLECSNGNIRKILDYEIKGGGGTSFVPVYD
ncbi:MAG: DUF2201 family putative metallopeptidase, partial [Candidatus Nanoarchaeia archaeon]